MSPSSLMFPKAANLFVISIWYCFLISRSFSFLRLNLSPSSVCAACLLTANLSLTFATTRQWSVSQSAPLKLRTSSMLDCHLLSINMWSIWLCVFPSGEVQVCLWMSLCGNIVLLTTRFFDVAKFTILTPLSILQNVRKHSPNAVSCPRRPKSSHWNKSKSVQYQRQNIVNFGRKLSRGK